MKLKPLIKKFSYNELIETCKGEGWRLPEWAEVREYCGTLGHEEFWVSDLPEKQDQPTHAHVFNTRWPQALQIANKHFILDAVVVVTEKVCEWKRDEDFNIYHTSCGDLFLIDEGTPKDNGFKFCPYCGEKIKDAQDD